MKCLLLLGALVSSVTLWGQAEANLPPNLRQLTLDEKSWMTTIGFPIAEYDYGNPAINLELSTALNEQEKGEKFTTISYIVGGVGALFLFIPKGGSTSGGKILGVGSAVMMLGGLTLNFAGMSKKMKARKRIENARYLFYEK